MRSAVIYGSFLDATEDLDPELFKSIWLIILRYAIDRVEPEKLSPMEKVIFELVRPNIDNNLNRRKTIDNNCEQLQTIADNCKQKPTASNDEDEDVDVDVDVDVEKKKRPRPRFRAPSIDEVRAYCKERSSTVDPEKFIAYYEANGWMVGRNHMKDWKAAVRNWESREKKSQPKTSAYNAKVESRGYDFDDLERQMMDRQVEGL